MGLLDWFYRPTLRAAAAPSNAYWPVCCLGQATCTAEVLRVRAAPSTLGAYRGALKAGDVVDVWCFDAEWRLIQTQDGALTGWAHGEYLEPVGVLTP